ncbi:hypothetical protein [Xanthomonas campestris]|uniref:hypothetical protein n=1 Tax=Xanthomonas TaxID=338 RepID=UPI001E447824|nr:hypothetical protein [Xanthomonas campestris]
MNCVTAYWVLAARENHRLALETRGQLRNCRRHGLADRRKQLRKELQCHRTRRNMAMVRARLTRDEVARVDALRSAELARLPAGVVPGLMIGGRPVLATSSETPP